MKPFSAPGQRKPVSAARARNAALVNQLATPGLGSLMAGRFVAGAVQLLLACAGFGLLMAWFLRVMIFYYSLMAAEYPANAPNLHNELWKAGAMLFGAAWLWSLFTSLSLLREGRANDERAVREAEAKPPIIADHGSQT